MITRRKPAPSEAPPPPAVPADPTAEIRQLEARLAELRAAAAPPPAPEPAPPPLGVRAVGLTPGDSHVRVCFLELSPDGQPLRAVPLYSTGMARAYAVAGSREAWHYLLSLPPEDAPAYIESNEVKGDLTSAPIAFAGIERLGGGRFRAVRGLFQDGEIRDLVWGEATQAQDVALQEAAGWLADYAWLTPEERSYHLIEGY
jgi:hypothetical protein